MHSVVRVHPAMLLASPLMAASAGLVGPWERAFEVERASGHGSDAVSAPPPRPCTSDEANCVLASFQVLLFTSAVRGTQITQGNGGVDLARHIQPA